MHCGGIFSVTFWMLNFELSRVYISDFCHIFWNSLWIPAVWLHRHSLNFLRRHFGFKCLLVPALLCFPCFCSPHSFFCSFYHPRPPDSLFLVILSCWLQFQNKVPNVKLMYVCHLWFSQFGRVNSLLMRTSNLASAFSYFLSYFLLV